MPTTRMLIKFSSIISPAPSHQLHHVHKNLAGHRLQERHNAAQLRVVKILQLARLGYAELLQERRHRSGVDVLRRVLQVAKRLILGNMRVIIYTGTDGDGEEVGGCRLQQLIDAHFGGIVDVREVCSTRHSQTLQ